MTSVSKTSFKLIAAFLILSPCLATAEHHDLMLTGGNIIDVNTGETINDGVIAITAGKISLVGGRSLLADHGADTIVDVGAKFLIPGLWDMHVHIEGADLVEDNLALLPVYLAYGITTVRDAASDLGEQVLQWRGEINAGTLLGPQIYTAGRKLEGIDSIWKGDLEIANEHELQAMLDKLDKYDVDFVKITENAMKGPLFLKSVLAAKSRGYQVSGHIPYDLTIEQLAQAGLDTIEHASYVLRLGGDEETISSQVAQGSMSKRTAGQSYVDNFDQNKAIHNYRMLADNDVAIVPTLIGGRQLAFLDVDDHQDDEFHQYLTERFMANYQWRIDRMANDSPEMKAGRKQRFELIQKQLPLLQEAGVTLIAGSDSAALNTFVYPALALHEELQLFQEAGLSPLYILQSATINGARYFSQEKLSANLAVGMEADMVVLDRNPLDDISATLSIHAVVNNGQLFSRKDLDRFLLDAKRRKVELDAARRK